MQKLSQLSMQKLRWPSFCILQAIKNRSRGRPAWNEAFALVWNRGVKGQSSPVGGVVFPADSGCGRGSPSKRPFVIREAKLSLLRASHCEYLIGPKPTWVQ